MSLLLKIARMGHPVLRETALPVDPEMIESDEFQDFIDSMIATMLSDDVDWVRSNAVGALSVFGSKANAVIPQLNRAAETADERLKQRIDETLESIGSAKESVADEQQHNKMLRAIAAYCAARR